MLRTDRCRSFIVLTLFIQLLIPAEALAVIDDSTFVTARLPGVGAGSSGGGARSSIQSWTFWATNSGPLSLVIVVAAP